LFPEFAVALPMMRECERVIVLILDSCGVGELPDAADYDDQGSNTIANTAAAVGGLDLPHLRELGLGNIIPIEGVPPVSAPLGSFGKMATLSSGKDSTVGHWELMGLVTTRPFPVYPEGFPEVIIKRFREATGLEILGNRPASGTEIIKELGEEHCRTGKPILYTSADSVFQLAAHEEVIPIEKQYEICRKAREILFGEHGVARVIARPFVGRPGSFTRTERRKDFSLAPPSDTLLDLLKRSGIEVTGIGKVEDLFGGRGFTRTIHTKSNDHGMEVIGQVMVEQRRGLIFANLVDFDMLWGHRNDYQSFAKGLEAFDRKLPDYLALLGGGDLFIITADHGCDPTTPSTDHSREYVPLLVTSPGIRAGVDLGTRTTLGDVGATVSEALGFPPFGCGVSFLKEIR
jgi:phosphopentomutase